MMNQLAMERVFPSQRNGLLKQIEQFADDKMPLNDMPLFFQDLLDTDLLFRMPMHFRTVAQHFLDMGFCRVLGLSALQ